jgi:hypothetical protein
MIIVIESHLQRKELIIDSMLVAQVTEAGVRSRFKMAKCPTAANKTWQRLTLLPSCCWTMPGKCNRCRSSGPVGHQSGRS